MTTRTGFTAPRIVALAVIATIIAFLGYLRLAPADKLTVPDGARAGQLDLEPCTYPTEKGAWKADCGTLTVPENRANPRSRPIALPVTRIRAQSDRPAEPIFRLEGGPGLTNMTFPAASRFAQRHDVVLVGYRGVDSSTVLDCPEVVSAMRHTHDLLDRASFATRANAFRDCAHRLQVGGVDLAGYTLPQRADDLEAARRALGYGRVDLLSESAGTRTAAIYGARHPRSIHRSVMIAVNPPGRFLWDPATTDRQLHRYFRQCSADAACRQRSGDMAAAMTSEIPGRWGPLRIKPGNVRVGSFFGLMEATSAAGPLSAPATLDSWRSAAAGDASGLWLMSLMADLVFPRAQIWGDVAAVGRADLRPATDHFAQHRPSILRDAGTEFIWSGGQLARAWPASRDDNAYSRVRRSDVETLMIGGEHDFATPPEHATRELLPHLPNGRQVVLPGLGHTNDFWKAEPAAGSRLITTFLDRGEVDASGFSGRPVDFEPKLAHTTLAKRIAGVMTGLAALTVLSLLWMRRRVGKRGRIGHRTGAALRAVYTPVLGLGGWFAGALVAMTAFPGVPLDSEPLMLLSIGAPVALGTYWGWVDRDRRAATRTAGLAAAAAGALLGAWLGFGAIEGFLAIVTTIAGAAAGANLMLIATDVSDARSRMPARSRDVLTGK